MRKGDDLDARRHHRNGFGCGIDVLNRYQQSELASWPSRSVRADWGSESFYCRTPSSGCCRRAARWASMPRWSKPKTPSQKRSIASMVFAFAIEGPGNYICCLVPVEFASNGAGRPHARKSRAEQNFNCKVCCTFANAGELVRRCANIGEPLTNNILELPLIASRSSVKSQTKIRRKKSAG